MIRVLTSDGSKDLSETVAHDTLNRQLEKVNHKVAKKLIPQLKSQIQPLFKFCEQQANQQSVAIAEASLKAAQEEIAAEIDRLTELAKLNPNVRKAEIQFLNEKLEKLKPNLQNLQINLDSMRLIVAA